MRLKSPSSRSSMRVHVSPFDVFWAAISPLLALYFRDAYILSSEGAPIALLYCGLSFACSMAAVLGFRLSDSVSRYFSVHDALNVVKATVVAGLMSGVILFTVNRLDGIPRSTPLLQVLIFAAGLLTVRALILLSSEEGERTQPSNGSAVEHIIVIGSTRLSSLYIRFLRSCAPDRFQIIAVLDEASEFIGRTICSVPVVALPQHIEPVIEEFAVHGVRTDRVIIGGSEDLLTEDVLNDVRRVCTEHNIALDFVPKLIGLHDLTSPPRTIVPPSIQPVPADVPAYSRIKRIIDVVAALAAIIALSPLFILASMLVLFDLGSPVLFWQQRIGRGGGSFLLYKFRTLRPPFDRHGTPIPRQRRLSAVGFLLRKTRIDELPQLFNVLVGDMSLIGPRPLLPQDQPANECQRLSLRPGITGWAQVHGGNLVTAEEKGALDHWYIRHMSLRLDLRIAALTLRCLLTGERRSETAIAQAESAVVHAAAGSNGLAAKSAEAREASTTETQTAPLVRIAAGARPTRPRRRAEPVTPLR
jgi:lipopolysaccharide/colanic/teichoic acid biosynthesis glycosyltransferase